MPTLSFGQMGVFVSVFFVVLGFVRLLPTLLDTYGERTRVTLTRTTRELDKFFLNVKPLSIIIGMAVVGALLGAVTGSWVLATAVAIAGLFTPKVMLSVWKDLRTGKVEAQLQDALILMGNTLKSGMDMAAGIERVALDMKPPISEEFGLVLNAYRLGTPIETALMDMTLRIQSRNLETAVYAITIQRETGGNITKIFDQLVLNIREESKLQKKIQAMTSQARTQIIFLAIFPWILAAVFYFLAPEFMAPAIANPWGQLAMVLLVIWEIIGIFVTKKIVAVDV